METTLDHLVITAPSLQLGVDWIENLFGVPMTSGGKHPIMGTHNALLKIGDRQYLEVIAIDPDQPVPNRERWFGLDHLKTAAQPCLVTWVARTTSIQSVVHTSPWNPSSIETMHRGTFEWSITIPSHDDWKNQAHLPLFIQWGDDRHPTDQLPDSSVRLIGLALRDPNPDLFRSKLPLVHFDGGPKHPQIQNGAPQMTAEFNTPKGRVFLETKGQA